MPEVSAARTPVTIADMVGAMAAAWRDVLGNDPAPSSLGVLLAQWALETAQGASMVCYNVGNFKAPNPKPDDLFCYFATWEVVNGQRIELRPPDPGCRFAAFATLTDGCHAYLTAMISRWRSAWPFVILGDVDGFAAELHAHGYYTAPEAEYAKGMHARLALLEPTIERVLAAAAPTDPAPMAVVPAQPDVTPDQLNTDDDPETKP